MGHVKHACWSFNLFSHYITDDSQCNYPCWDCGMPIPFIQSNGLKKTEILASGISTN